MNAAILFARVYAALILAGPVLAFCADAMPAQPCSQVQVDAVIRALQWDAGTPVPQASACKIWPKDEAVTLAAIAYPGAPQAPLLVAMLESGSGRLIAGYHDTLVMPEEWQVGAFSLKIDTARYDVKPGMRAFGVDVAAGEAAGCCESGLTRLRSLYVLDGTALRPLMRGFPLGYRRVAQGAAPVVENLTLKIALEPAASNGFADLTVFSVSAADNGTLPGGEPFRYRLEYDGNRYPLEALKRAYREWLR